MFESLIHDKDDSISLSNNNNKSKPSPQNYCTIPQKQEHDRSRALPHGYGLSQAKETTLAKGQKMSKKSDEIAARRAALGLKVISNERGTTASATTPPRLPSAQNNMVGSGFERRRPASSEIAVHSGVPTARDFPRESCNKPSAIKVASVNGSSEASRSGSCSTSLPSPSSLMWRSTSMTYPMMPWSKKPATCCAAKDGKSMCITSIVLAAALALSP